MPRQASAFLVAQNGFRNGSEKLDETRDPAAFPRRREFRLLRIALLQKPGQVIRSLLDAGGQTLGSLLAQDIMRVASRRQPCDPARKPLGKQMGQGAARGRPP